MEKSKIRALFDLAASPPPSSPVALVTGIAELWRGAGHPHLSPNSICAQQPWMGRTPGTRGHQPLRMGPPWGSLSTRTALAGPASHL